MNPEDDVPKMPGAPGGDAQSEFVMRWGGGGPAGAKGDKGDRGDAMPSGARRAIVFLFIFSVLLAGANLFYTTRQVGASQAKWCTTLDLLTARPVPRPADPAANPSREQAYVFYTDFRSLRRSLGCG